VFSFSIEKNWVFTSFFEVVHQVALGIPRWKPLGGHHVLFGNPLCNPRSNPLGGLQVEKKKKYT
jgi:hypothetical protein